MSERVERNKKKSARPAGSLGDFQGGPIPHILVGHLDLHHNFYRVKDFIVTYYQSQVRVREH